MALKVAMHNWMRAEPIETTITRLGRSGYDGIEISGEPATYDSDEIKRLLGQHGLNCWGSVTLMTGGRDLVHEDHYVRLASVQYVKDCLSFVASLGGDILTVVPSTVADKVAEGLTSRQIATTLFLSPRTVDAHLSRIYRKLDINTRARLAALVADHG